jgi:hypothetical protein
MKVIQGGKPVEDGQLDVISDFLERYQMAKIVFILDTHCGENGCFVYSRDPLGGYKQCSLEEVSHIPQPIFPATNTQTQILKDCCPPVLFQYVSNKPEMPQHTHRSLILNLACGATVNHPTARHLLLNG